MTTKNLPYLFIILIAGFLVGFLIKQNINASNQQSTALIGANVDSLTTSNQLTQIDTVVIPPVVSKCQDVVNTNGSQSSISSLYTTLGLNTGTSTISPVNNPSILGGGPRIPVGPVTQAPFIGGTIGNPVRLDMIGLTINKIVIGGTKNINDFSFVVSGNGFQKTVKPGTKNTFTAGNYMITETPKDPNYKITLKGECQFDIYGNIVVKIDPKDKNIICEVTNTYIGPPIPFDLVPTSAKMISKDMGSSSGPVINYSVTFANTGPGSAVFGPNTNTHFVLTRDSDNKIFSDTTPFSANTYTMQPSTSYTVGDLKYGLGKNNGICGANTTGSVWTTITINSKNNPAESITTNNTIALEIPCIL